MDVTISLPDPSYITSLDYITVQNDYIGDVYYLSLGALPPVNNGDIIKVVKNSFLVIDAGWYIYGASDDAAFTDRMVVGEFVYGGVIRGPVTLEIFPIDDNEPVA